jgi:elongation factor G
MPIYNTGDIRNVAFVGHGTSGKTSLVEAMLFKAGAIRKQGRVPDGNTVLDTDADEKERMFSVSASVAHCTWPVLGAERAVKKKYLRFIDCPGYPDFVGETLGPMAAVELAVIALDAEDGIKVNTRKMFDAAKKRGMPIAFVINRLDRDNAKFDELVAALKEAFGNACTPLLVPDAVGGALSSVTNVLDVSADDEKLGAARAELVETIVEADDALMERYLAEEPISPEELSSAFTGAIVKGTLMPVMAVSVEKDLGVTEILDFIAAYAPDATTDIGRKCVKAPVTDESEPVKAETDADGPFRALVIKCISDEFVGKMTFFRIVSGRLKANTTFYNVRTDKTERIGNITMPQGGDKSLAVNMDEAIAGDIVYVAKVENTQLGDTLTAGEKVAFEPIDVPQPWVSLAVEPKSRADEQRISSALQKLAASDPTFQLRRDAQTSEMVVSGMTDMHLRIMLGKLTKMNVEVITRQPKVPYKETVTREATTSYRHKKQTGGRGQFAQVHITISPMERGSIYEFEDAIVGGVIPKGFITSVDKGIRETMQKGVLSGFPVEDVKVRLFDGKTHDVDSSENAFKIAAREAFKAAFNEASPVLLEPIVLLEVSIPNSFVGDILGHLNSRRGRVLSTDSLGTAQVIQAQVPLAEILNYSTELRSMTGGEGSYSMSLSHYDVLPNHLQGSVIAQNRSGGKENEELGIRN